MIDKNFFGWVFELNLNGFFLFFLNYFFPIFRNISHRTGRQQIDRFVFLLSFCVFICIANRFRRKNVLFVELKKKRLETFRPDTIEHRTLFCILYTHRFLLLGTYLGHHVNSITNKLMSCLCIPNFYLFIYVWAK